MRRTAPRHVTGRREGDVRKNLSAEQLEWIGTIAIAWNELELLIHFAMATGHEIHPSMWMEVATRIGGLDGTFHLIRKAAEIAWFLTDDDRSLFEDTIATCSQCKKYRDGVIHARVLDAPSGLGIVVQRRAKEEHVLLTVPALQGLYERLVWLRFEMVRIVIIFHYFNRRMSFGDEERTRALAFVQRHVAQLRDCQSSRKSLAPLPPFPELPPDLLETEDPPPP